MHRANAGFWTLVALALIATGWTAPAQASSHREAPLITEMPKVDGTDFYMFRSYETGRENYVTFLANYIPIQAPYGGPNFFELDPDARYQINIENDGTDGDDMVFEFQFFEVFKDQQLTVGGVQVAHPLRTVNPISVRQQLQRSLPLHRDRHPRRRAQPGDQRAHQRHLLRQGVRQRRLEDDRRLRRLRQQPDLPDQHPGLRRPGQGVRRPAQGVVRGQPRRGVRPGQPRTRSATANAKANVLDDRTSPRSRSRCRSPCLTGVEHRDRRLDHRLAAAHPPAPRRPHCHRADARERRLRAGLAARHAAGQRGGDRAARQEQVQRQPARGRRGELRHLRHQPDAARDPRDPVRRARLPTTSRAPTWWRRSSPASPGSTSSAWARCSASTPRSRRRRRRRRTTSASSAATTPASPTAAARATTWSTSSCGWRWASLCHAFPGVYCNPADAPSGTLPLHRSDAPGRVAVRRHVPVPADSDPRLAQQRVGEEGSSLPAPATSCQWFRSGHPWY